MNRLSQKLYVGLSSEGSRFSLVACLLLAWTATGHAQSTASYATTSTLPDAPGVSLMSHPEDVSNALATDGSASIAGTVLDPSGAAIVNARVSLINPNGQTLRDTQSGQKGEFTFSTLPAGTFQLVIQSAGFASFTSEAIRLLDKQTYVAPNISLVVANASTEVQVTGDATQIAAAQIKAAEKQRILGFIPNFYTSFIYDAAPLSTKQKYTFALRETFDPVRFVGTGLGAGIQQANNSFKGYGRGAAGYGKRYAALYGDGLTSDILSHAVFPALFHQDPRYFYQGSGTFKSRLLHAASFAFVARSDSGKTIPNYSYLLGDIGAGALSNLYYPHADRGVGLVFINAGIGIAGRAAGAVGMEFVLSRITTHRAGNGKP